MHARNIPHSVPSSFAWLFLLLLSLLVLALAFVGCSYIMKPGCKSVIVGYDNSYELAKTQHYPYLTLYSKRK